MGAVTGGGAMTTDLGRFTQKMARLAAEIGDVPREVAGAAAFVVKTSVQGELRSAAPKGTLRVGKRRNTRVGARYDLGSDGRSARVFMFGPAQLLERDTSAHRIPRPMIGRGRSQRQNTKPILIPGVGVRAWAEHPGTRGKHPWAKGVANALPKVGPAAAKAYFGPARKIFGS